MSRKSRRRNRQNRKIRKGWSLELRVGLTLFSVIAVNLAFGAISSLV